MKIQPWMKTTLVAMGGGALSGAFAALSDPQAFHIQFGNGKLLLMMAEGAGAALLALFLKSPLGQEIVAEVKDAQQNQAQIKQTLSTLETPPSGPVPPKPIDKPGS